MFEKAGKLTGVKVADTPDSGQYFNRADNAVFAEAGIPAHTLCVAYMYPDYHGLEDHWQKIDYANLARVDRMVALGLVLLADDPEAPRWNEGESRTLPYRNAWKKRHAE